MGHFLSVAATLAQQDAPRLSPLRGHWRELKCLPLALCYSSVRSLYSSLFLKAILKKAVWERCSKQMLNVKRQFKQLKQRMLALISPSPEPDLAQLAAQERRSEALTKFAQAAFTILIGVWLAPLFFGQANLVMAAAVVCSVPFVIQGFKLWFSTNSVDRSKTSYKSPSAAPQNPKTKKLPTPARQDTKTQKPP